MTTDAKASPLQVDFQDTSLKIRLAHDAQILEDPAGSRTLDQVRHSEHGWTDYHGDAFNFAFNESAWWVRVRLHNAQPREPPRLLDLGSALQDEMDVYVVRAEGKPIEHIATGDRRPFNTRPLATRVPTFPLHFALDEQVDVYIKLATHDGLHEIVTPTLWASTTYVSSMQRENFVYGLYYGALLSILIYHLFLFASTRQLNFGLYVLYIGAFSLWSLTFKGYAFQYLWPDSPAFNNQILAISACTSYCCFALFMRAYFNTEKSLTNWMNRLMVAMVVINAICIVPACLDQYALSFELSIPCGIALMLSASLVILLMLWRGSRPARYLTLSFAVLSLGVLLYYLRLLGWIPENEVNENGLLFGSGLQILLLAFGLADQMNQLKEGKLRAERMALSAQAALNQELESLVKRRTQALTAVNQRVVDTVIHDELTGAFNARHFEKCIESELSNHALNQRPMALCLFDIDGFDHYSACHGHVSADQALQQVAHAVQNRLHQPEDQLFRLDGSEFAILISSPDWLSNTVGLTNTLRVDIESLGLTYSLTDPLRHIDSSATAVLTALFGVVALGTDTPPDGPRGVYQVSLQLLERARIARVNKHGPEH